MQYGVVHTSVKIKITATAVIAPVYETIYTVDALNLSDESTKVWFTVFTGDTVQTIRFLNMILKSYNGIQDDDLKELDEHLMLSISETKNKKFLDLSINGSLCYLSREELLNTRDSFLKHLKDL